MESETILHLHPRFGVLTIHGKLAFVGMEIVVAGGEFYIVVERIGGGKAVEDAAACHVDVGKGGEFQCVVQQFLRESCCGKPGIAIDGERCEIARCVFMAILHADVPVVTRLPVYPCKGVEGVAPHGILPQAASLCLAYVLGDFGAEDKLTDGQ